MTRDFIACVIRGEVSEAELSGFLLALKEKGETADDIVGAAQGLLAAAKLFPRPDYVFADLVGTGGDGIGTVNISTAAAFVVAEMGLPVAKHGNVSVSSKCGSADVLRSLGVKLELSPQQARACLDEVGICFLLAPLYHEGMRHAMSVRKALGVRTIFNLLGPLVNPARPDFELLGVYDEKLLKPMAETLQMMGLKASLVVHGSGLDEIAIHGPTKAMLLRDNCLTEMTLTPEMLGIKKYDLSELIGGEPTENATCLREVLTGRASEAHRAAVAVNAAALYWLYDDTQLLKETVQRALEVIVSGSAVKRLERFVEFTQRD